MELWTNVSLILQPGASACSPDSEVVAGRAVPPDGVHGSISADRACFLMPVLILSCCAPFAKGALEQLKRVEGVRG